MMSYFLGMYLSVSDILTCSCFIYCILIEIYLTLFRASQVALVVKNMPAGARDVKEAGSIPRSGRSPGGRHGNPLQDSCLENPMDRGAWWATVHGVAGPDMTE